MNISTDKLGQLVIFTLIWKNIIDFGHNLVKLIHSIEESRNTILAQMQDLCNTLPEYSVVKEMDCIGDTLAPRIIAEIGDVRRFKNKHSLIAYAGIDAPPYQSGAFHASERHISKRGNSYLRKTGYEIMQSLIKHKPAKKNQ